MSNMQLMKLSDFIRMKIEQRVTYFEIPIALINEEIYVKPDSSSIITFKAKRGDQNEHA